MRREIYKEKHDTCEICTETKPIVCFEEDYSSRYEDYHVEFKICKECFIKKIDKENDDG